MRFKSFVVRSRPHRAPRNSLDPNPSPTSSIPDEARFASGVNITQGDSGDVEIVPDTFSEGDVPSKKRHCLGTSETIREGGGLNLEACIVCEVTDERVTHCSGTGCPLWFHWECLDQEVGSAGEDLAKTYCPYCWYKVIVRRHNLVREKAVEAEKNVSKYLSKETEGKDGSVDRTDFVRDQDSDRSRKEGMPSFLTEERDYQPQDDDTEKFQDAEEDKDDDEATKDQTEVNTGAGEEEDQIQQNERPRRRRRQLVLSDISSDESTNEGNGKDVNEQIASSALVVTTPSVTMMNQQRIHSSTTKLATSKAVRDISSLKSDQRKRLYWTPEEEEMLKVGVEKFTAEANKNIPWRKILEMGEEVFHETRTPSDLKDKWRSRMGARGKKAN